MDAISAICTCFGTVAKSISCETLWHLWERAIPDERCAKASSVPSSERVCISVLVCWSVPSETCIAQYMHGNRWAQPGLREPNSTRL